MSERGGGSSPASACGLSRAGRWLRGIQAVCFVVAGLGHALDMWQEGWLPYDWAPLPLNVFWATLVVWDPLAAGLLLWRPRAGVALALVIMVVDVAVNSSWKAARGPVDWYENVPLQLQTLFFGFVAGATPLIWLSAGRAACATTSGATSGVAKAKSETAGGRPGTKAALILGGCLVASSIIVVLGLRGVSTQSNPRPVDLQGVDEEAKKLQGTWGVTSFEVRGEKVPGNELKGMRLTVKDDEIILQESETKKEEGRFKLDTSKKPNAMDWTATGPREQTALCIYELDGDILKLCWRKPGGNRPTEFTGKDTDGLLILKKQ